jgi:hypothetical protein
MSTPTMFMLTKLLPMGRQIPYSRAGMSTAVRRTVSAYSFILTLFRPRAPLA